MSKFIKALGFIFVGVSASVSADTVSEIKQVLLDNIQFTNQELKQDPMRISKKGSKEFFSSGGLLNEISRNTTDNTFVLVRKTTMIDQEIHHRNIYWMRNTICTYTCNIIILCAYSLEVP